MKKLIFLSGLAAFAFACNNQSNSSSAGDSTQHGADHNKQATTENNGNMNPITATMEQMMHQMHASKPTGNNNIDFANMMVMHHKGAVEMAKVELEKGSDAELKAFAQKVIDDQNKEIDVMQQFLMTAAKTQSPNAQDFQKALNQSMMAMMDGNTTVYNNIDKDFAAQMIPHHQSAVDMARAYQKFGNDVTLQTLCKNIISSQTKENTRLKDWLTRNMK